MVNRVRTGTPHRRVKATGWQHIALGVALTSVSVPVAADNLNWTLTPRVTLGAEITDNARLAPRGDESSDLIGQVTPGFTLRGEGARTTVNVNYSWNNRFYLDDSREDRSTHRLFARGTTELVPETFFVDANASRTQGAASLLGPVGVGDTTPRDNLQETTRYGVSPYLRTRYGRFAQQEIRYGYDEVRYHRSGRGGSHVHSASYRLDSGPAFNRPFWQLAGDYEDERFDDGGSGQFGSVSATAGYRFSRFFQAFVVGGQEFNDYLSARDDVDDTFWEVGATWSPTRATSIEGRYGERFFGKTRSLAATHASRRASYRLSYSESITSTRGRAGPRLQEMANMAGFDSVDELLADEGFQQAIDLFGFDAVMGLFGLEDEALIENYFFVQSWRGAWQYQTGRSTFRVTGFHTRREAEAETGLGLFDDDRETRGGTAAWTWSWGPRTDSTLSTSFVRTDFRSDTQEDRQDDYWNIRASVGRDLTPSARATLAYRHQQRESNERANEYRENAVIATLTKEF